MTTLETKPTKKERVATTARTGRSRPLRPHVIGAIFKRNFLSYFSNPAGYVFITLFVFISSWVAFWQPGFFTSNLANLDQLNRYMPYLLLVFIPAITMSLWADERRQGTEELLLTLPAHDLDVVLGKFFAALGIYTVALVFCLTHVVILAVLGKPDLGVLFATYFGYWLMGALLIAIGMVASLLSSNVTVAFILGALFCAIPIFLGRLGDPFGSTVRRQVEDWSIPAQFQDFGSGVITLSGIFYFVALTVAMLYLNMVLLGRRHWAGGEASRYHWAHSLVRFAAVVLALFSLTVMIEQWGVRADASAERLHTLSQQSRDLIASISDEHPVLIQAYYSPDVPREYVEVKTDLLGLLKEYQALSGGKIRLNLVPTELYSEQAREAEKRFGIEPRRIFSDDQGRQMSSEILLGVAFTAGVEEVVIPFFDRGLPVEYELTRLIRVVSKSNRKKVGILTTDAKLMGGFDMRSFNQTPEWSIVTELKKQYDVNSVSPDSPISSEWHVLLVAQPSSLAQRQIDNLTDYVKKGGGVLLFLDPFPVDNPQISPDLPKMPAGGPFGGGPPPEPKGDLKPLLDLVGIDWPTSSIVWNMYNPLPKLADLQSTPEIVFIGTGSGAADAFNLEQSATTGLQLIVTLFPGMLRPKSGGSPLDFVPLLRTGPSGGTILWNDVVQQGFMGFQGINPRRRHIPTGMTYTLAARVSGEIPADNTPETPKKDDTKKDGDAKKEAKPAKSPTKINVIAIADLDMIGEQFFQMRLRKLEDLDFDNVSFVLNCVDVLAGDESYVGLRRKRPKHRTLELLEKQSKDFAKSLQEATKRAEDEATDELDGVQKAFDKEVEQVRNRTDWDERTKDIQLANLQQVAQRRLDVKKQNIEDNKLNKIRESRSQYEQSTREIQNYVRYAAAALPPLPPLFLGIVVWVMRLLRENVAQTPNGWRKPKAGPPPMNEILKTLSLVAVALALTGAAFVTTRDRTKPDAEFDDQGKSFFPDFKDPLACTDLEVVEFDPSTATAARFRVMFKDKKWVIPSHYNYPADARDRLSKTAAAIMDLAKDTVRSNGAFDQEEMGVIDPLDAKVSTLKGRGKRITLRDESEKVLADIIIGNEIKGSERKDKPAQRYVRVPGQKRIYGVNIKAEPSVRFADWIETNLLKLEAGKIRRVVFDNYKIQEDPDHPRRLVLQRGDKSTLTRKDSAGPWTIDGTIPAEQELNEDKLRTLTDALGDLKIVGIRPRHPSLKNLDQEDLKLPDIVVASLINKGFFVTASGLYSDQGNVIVGTDEGVVYTLRYGGPVFSEGEELTRGEADDAPKKPDEKAKTAKDEAGKKQGTQENRFLMVTVTFDPSLVQKPESMEPKPVVKPTGPVELPANVFAPDPNDPKYQADQKAAKEKAEREKADYDKKIADGQKRVSELTERFGAWYYVTPGDSFRSINVDRRSLFQPKKSSSPGAGLGGLPGGVPSFKP